MSDNTNIATSVLALGIRDILNQPEIFPGGIRPMELIRSFETVGVSTRNKRGQCSPNFAPVRKTRALTAINLRH
jgi:hypothetical protein